jgi:hypothetical protein
MRRAASVGNWRTVNMAGSMNERDAGVLREYLGYSIRTPDHAGMDRFGPLSFNRDRPSLCGLNNWVGMTVNAVGNLAERNYSVERVADELRMLVGMAGTLLLKVHCGADWESVKCVATISVGEGLVVTGKPEVEHIEPVSDEQAIMNLFGAMSAPRP